MKAFSKLDKRSLGFFAALVWMIAAGSISALAAPKTQVLRSVADGTYTGPCCSTWDESVSVYEPSPVVPIVVTWSTDYQSNAPFIAGLSLNGGPCTFFGSGSLPAPTTNDGIYYASATFQWVILPGDYGLRQGRNVLSLCGGGVFSDTDTITIGFNTLAARLAK
jgi:hypothetical protein